MSSTSPDVDGGPSYKPRVLVLCFDGTANEYDSENTNVVKFFAMLRKDCDDQQLCYYQTGVGTYLPPGMWGAMGMWIAKVLDGAIAWYLDAHVMDGYKFLMRNYRPGDKITIFGFSRGAYTARALAGFLTKVGLLPRDNVEQVTFAYKIYKRTDPEGLVEASGFKQTFCRSVTIEFLGVWDTVASTGILFSRNLPFTTNNSMIKTFRHVLSLDERRAKFVPTFWQLSTVQPPKPKPGLVATPAAFDSAAVQTASEPASQTPLQESPHVEQGNDQESPQSLLPSKKTGNTEVSNRKKSWFSFGGNMLRFHTNAIGPQESDLDTTDVKQVWFAGAHSDVGGGAVENADQSSLSNISLRWMVREVVAAQCGIQFDASVMAQLGVHVSLPVREYYLAPNPGSDGASAGDGPLPSEKDAAADKIDATMPLHDELRIKPLWWILEVIPMPFSWLDAKGKSHTKWKLHLGRGRYVDQLGPLVFHETVRIRMNDANLQYTPAAKYDKGKETYVW